MKINLMYDKTKHKDGCEASVSRQINKTSIHEERDLTVWPGKKRKTSEAENDGLMIRLRGYDTEGRQRTQTLVFLGMNKGSVWEEHSVCGLSWNGCQSLRTVSRVVREAALLLHTHIQLFHP